MPALTEYLSILEACGGELTELDRQRRWESEAEWRHVYAAGLFAATGKWKWRGFDWHVFSYQYADCVRSHKAIAQYNQCEAPVLIVMPEGRSFPPLPAFQLSAATLPQFQGSKLDVIVRPEDLDWTMAFTHEEDTYFARRGSVACSRRPRRPAL